MSNSVPSSPPPDPDADLPSSRVLLWLTLLVVLAGMAAGFVGGTFRWLLNRTELWRTELVDWAHAHGAVGMLAPVAVAAAAVALATAIGVRWPAASGSGIQQVEAAERDEDAPVRAPALPARYIGGLLSIGAGGMVLGREGPTVHMAAACGAFVGRIARVARDDLRVMQTVLAGAGLAVAFNAPLGGAIFVFEEVARKVRMRYVLWTLFAVTAAIVCSRLVLGDHPDFRVRPLTEPGLETLPLFALFGVLVGMIGVAYNVMIDRCLTAFGAVTALPAVAKGALIGALIGVGLVFVPEAVGGGDTVTQGFLDGREAAFWSVLVFLALRFCTGPLCYAAGTPGGLFAPMLALGTLCGVAYAGVVDVVGVDLTPDTRLTLMIAGMSALFAASVRAPFTGVVLVIEMTAVTTVTIPMVATAATAVLVATLFRSEPVYDKLRERMLGHLYAAESHRKDPPQAG